MSQKPKISESYSDSYVASTKDRVQLLVASVQYLFSSTTPLTLLSQINTPTMKVQPLVLLTAGSLASVPLVSGKLISYRQSSNIELILIS